jgi:hypothetical protein
VENLLKLTEFPFSYSLLGIFVLLGGQHIDLSNISYIQFAPLLVLIGFLATTLSITDPFGRLLRLIGRYFAPISFTSETLGVESQTVVEMSKRVPWRAKIMRFFEKIIRPFQSSIQILAAPSIGSITISGLLDLGFDSPEEFFRENLKNVREEIALRRKALQKRPIHREGILTLKESSVEEAELKDISTEPVEVQKQKLEELKKKEHDIISAIHYGDLLKEQKRVVETRWISQEIDKIVAMFYFVTIMLIFFWALFNSSFSNQFLEVIKPIFGSQSVDDVALIMKALPLIAIVGITLAILFSVKALLDKVRTISIYFLAIDKGIGKDDSYVKSVEDSVSNKDLGFSKILVRTAIEKNRRKKWDNSL